MSKAVVFENVSKIYRGASRRYASLREDISKLGVRGGRRPTGASTVPIALRNVSFSVGEGESFGILGPNGAGKTTALKLISRISYPTTGRIRVRGRVASLIEVSSGVHPELTGRENIWLYGQILGMAKSTIRRRFDEIVAFSEIESYIDRPVKMYSSGMQLRLGFSIASHLEPDIFVVDEALAVGDAGFQAKCVERMTRLVNSGTSLVFVSHDLSAIEAICRRGLLLIAGEPILEGGSREVLRAYLDWIEGGQQDRLQSSSWHGSELLDLSRVTCIDSKGQERYSYVTGEEVTVELKFVAHDSLSRPFVTIGINDGRPGDLIICSMLLDGGAPESVGAGPFTVSCRIDSLPLLPRLYQLWCSVRTDKGFGDIFDWQNVGTLRIESSEPDRAEDAPHQVLSGGPIHVEHEWIT